MEWTDKMKREIEELHDIEKKIAFYKGQIAVCNHMLNRGEGPAYAQFYAMESLKFWENKRV